MTSNVNLVNARLIMVQILKLWSVRKTSDEFKELVDQFAKYQKPVKRIRDIVKNGSKADLRQLERELKRLTKERKLEAKYQLIASGVVSEDFDNDVIKAYLRSHTTKKGVEINEIFTLGSRDAVKRVIKKVTTQARRAEKTGMLELDICRGEINPDYLESVIDSTVGRTKKEYFYMSLSRETGKLLGFIYAYEPTNRTGVVEIELICTHKDGKKLIQKLIEDVKKSDRGINRIQLSSVASSVTFYRKLGFKNVTSKRTGDRCRRTEPIKLRVVAKKTQGKKPKNRVDILRDPSLVEFFKTLIEENMTDCTADEDFLQCLRTVFSMELCL